MPLNPPDIIESYQRAECAAYKGFDIRSISAVMEERKKAYVQSVSSRKAARRKQKIRLVYTKKSGWHSIWILWGLKRHQNSTIDSFFIQYSSAFETDFSLLKLPPLFKGKTDRNPGIKPEKMAQGPITLGLTTPQAPPNVPPNVQFSTLLFAPK